MGGRGERMILGGVFSYKRPQMTPQDPLSPPPPPVPPSRPDTHSLGGAMGEKGSDGPRIPYRGRGGLQMGGGGERLILGGGLQLKDPQNDPPGPPQCPHQGLKPTAWGGGQWERRGLMGPGVHVGGGGVFQWEVEGRGGFWGGSSVRRDPKDPPGPPPFKALITA